MLLYMDVTAYAKPLIVDSTVAIFNAFVVKILGVLISLAAFAPILFGSYFVVQGLNFYNSLVEALSELDIDVEKICRRILFISGSATVYIISLCIYNSSHSICFYEKITQQPISWGFFYVVVLSSYYKNICLFVMTMHSFLVFLVMFLLNKFLYEIQELQFDK